MLRGDRGATALDPPVSGVAMRKIIQEPQPSYGLYYTHSYGKWQ